MILESCWWKRDLFKIARDLSRRSQQKRWPEASRARVEQNIMLGFYIVRKLVEAKKISDKTSARLVHVTAYKWKGKEVTLLNWHKIHQLYDLNKGYQRKVKINFIYNQFIHSYVFLLCFKENGPGLEGVFVSSDKERHNFLYYVDLAELIDIFKQISKDYPNKMCMIYNPEKSDYDVASVTNKLQR